MRFNKMEGVGKIGAGVFSSVTGRGSGGGQVCVDVVGCGRGCGDTTATAVGIGIGAGGGAAGDARGMRAEIDRAESVKTLSVVAKTEGRSMVCSGGTRLRVKLGGGGGGVGVTRPGLAAREDDALVRLC